MDLSDHWSVWIQQANQDHFISHSQGAKACTLGTTVSIRFYSDFPRQSGKIAWTLYEHKIKERFPSFVC